MCSTSLECPTGWNWRSLRCNSGSSHHWLRTVRSLLFPDSAPSSNRDIGPSFDLPSQDLWTISPPRLPKYSQTFDRPKMVPHRTPMAADVPRSRKESLMGKRRLIRLVTVGLVCAGTLALWRLPIAAVHIGVFELDGDALDDSKVAGDDWNTPGGGGAVAQAFVVDGSGSQTIFTGGGSMDNIDNSSW